MMETILYMKDNAGAMREWGISAEGGVITIRHGQMGGAMQTQTETITEGKQLRSITEQAFHRMESRITRQKQRGYIEDEFEAAGRQNALNALGLIKPMLAQPIAKVKDIDYDDFCVTQPKFDGNRCMIYCEDGINKAYSRNGKPITSIQHILNDIVLEEGMIVDGELYCHGYPLQTIVSWVKRYQGDTLKLQYHLYDIASYLPYKGRSELIRGLPLGKSVSPVYGDPVASEGEVYGRFREYRNAGYEGAILRWGTAGYEDGKRSKSLVKVKEWHDDEFTVIDIIPSEDGWARLVCEDTAGRTFRVSAPGTMPEKYKIMINKELYISKKVTVEYANLTQDGIPFHPVAINFRDEIQ